MFNIMKKQMILDDSMDLGSLRLYLQKDVLNTIERYVHGIYTGTGKLLDRYRELPPDYRANLEKQIVSISGYLIPLLAGHPELGPVIEPLVRQIYTLFKTGYVGNELRSTAGEVEKTLENLMKYVYKPKKEVSKKLERAPQGVVASIIGLSILGLGFSLRLGSEITGKVGSVTPVSLPFMLIFCVVLLTSVFYMLKVRKK
jgi:hypothetical protein